MNKCLIVTSLILLLSACHNNGTLPQGPATKAIDNPIISDNEITLTQQISKLPIPSWVNKQNKTQALISEIVINQQTYNATRYCKPHNCGNDFMITLSGKDKENTSLVVSVSDVDAAITEPSKYASYWLIGKSNQLIKDELFKLLKNDPNWK